ncbi:chromate efflux transporter [Hoeflea sp. TYP-13]|uniref:chromate efflux transporter n=1 Tax=Hoeflea sp. TYP-13 TaxID=3230023 RepID=UPI0034C62C78
MNVASTTGRDNRAPESLSEATRAFAKIGILSFGGPAAQIALMHRVLVEERGWLTERQYLNALSFCMLLPGPEAMQLATYAGWRLHGVIGGLIAGLLFVLPGAAVMLVLAVIYAYLGDVPLVSALFLGIKAAVLVIVVEALLRVAKKALHLPRHWVIAALAFVGIFFLNLPFPLLILLAALYGFFAGRPKSETHEAPVATRSTPLQTLRTVLLWLAVWWVPILLAGTLAGEPILAELGRFFSKLAVVTFGGAYAVLAYMAQDVVNHYGWLSPGAMMDGLGLAETTPGPLILVTEFVGFLSAFGVGGLVLGVAGAIVTLWATFVPCFLWIFAGAPYIDWIGTQPRLQGALSGITAAVVGVILNLSIWFALHVAFAKVAPQHYGPVVLWQPELATVDWRVIVLALLSGVLLLRLHWGIVRVLAISALLGLALSYVG